MERFTYIRAESVPHALALLNEPKLRSRVLAGGTDLLLLLRSEPGFCDRAVDISLIPELHRITRDGDVVTIGAAATFSEVMQSPIVLDTAPLLAEACREVGAVQIRNMGTLGGNVANAAACADSLPALVCLDAVARVQIVQRDSSLSALARNDMDDSSLPALTQPVLLGPDVAPARPGDYSPGNDSTDSSLAALAQNDVKEETWPVAELVTGPNRTRIPPGGLLVSLGYRIPGPGSRGVFLKLGRRNAMAISRLTVAALGRLDEGGRVVEVRLVPGSVTPQIRRFTAVEEMLLGRVPDDALCAEAGRLAVEEMRRLSGHRWSSEFKEPALAAMVARALRRVFNQSSTPSPQPRPGSGIPNVLGPGAPTGSAGVWRGSVTPDGLARDASLLTMTAVADRLQADSSFQSPASSFRFTLNGQPVSADAPADTTLLALLRDHLGLTGTKEGCGVGECGACSVLVDGWLVNSCMTLAAQADGRCVTTIEGIRGADGGPNDLQQAFIDYGAVQCGYCIPGMVLAGEALLSANPRPSRVEIREAIAGNLCRCTGYQQIVDAIEATARARKA